MGLQLETGISVLTVFFQGLLSFFSPCVLPLLPVYIGYLSGGASTVAEDGTVTFPRGKVLRNTLFFVLGISAAFFLLGLGFTALGQFFSSYRTWFARISGLIILFFGLYQLGLFGASKTLSKDRRLPFFAGNLAMNPLTALLMGFTFSFAWTPCVGPVLSSVLLMAGSAGSASTGYMLIGTYTLGFVIPFLATGLFAGTLLNLFKRHVKIVRYTVKIGGVIMILMGIMVLTGWMNGITSYLSSATGTASAQETAPREDMDEDSGKSDPTPSEQEELPDAPDFTLVDQYGETHTLSDYKGKTIFLNFWTTWCGYCKKEMPDIQALYESYGDNKEDLIVLGVANPKTAEYPNAADGSEEEVIALLDEGGYTYPVVMDYSGEVFSQYGITSFPTTYMINSQGKVAGRIPGAVTGAVMESIVKEVMDGGI